MADQQQQNPTVISHYQLRQLIGILGISLPVVLVFGAYFFDRCSLLQPSISHYYYSIMHIVFVGTLCVLGGFLITYRGTSSFENRVSNLAGVFAFGVAVCPTDLEGFMGLGGDGCQFIQLTTSLPGSSMHPIIGKLHFGFAAALFVCFIIFCKRIFQEPDEGRIDEKKKRRNKIYHWCGNIIIISIACILVITIIDRVTKNEEGIFPFYIYIFETTSLLPFGFSWLLKGSVNWPHSQNKILQKVIRPLR